MTLWILRILRKEKVLLDYYVEPDGSHYTRSMNYTRLSSSDIRIQGYLKGKRMLDKMKYYGLPVYVRFHDLTKAPPYMVPITGPDGKTTLQKSKETSSTLHDYFSSNAQQNFVKGMTTKANLLGKMDQKQLMMLAIVGIGAAVGLYMMFMR